MRLKIWAVLLVPLLSEWTNSSKILAYFPFPAYSHHKVFQPVLYELGNRGHAIDYYSPFDMESPHPNVTRVFVRNILEDVMKRVKDVDFTRQLRMPVHRLLSQINRFSIETTKEICDLEPIRRLIQSDTDYELVIHEGPFIQEHAGVLRHKFKAPGVAVLPSPTISIGEVTGLPDNPSYLVDTKVAYSTPMTFLQRLHNTYATWLTVWSHYALMRQTDAIVATCFRYPGSSDRPHLSHLSADDALILMNAHHSLGFSYPTAPHVKHVGGVNVLPTKPLPKDLEIFMEQASGIVYFSLGSIFDMSSVWSVQVRDACARAFSRMNETILWKWNGEPWQGMPSNVRISKWFPQEDVLAHKNVKLFITQGGLVSLFESIHHAVPVLVIPIFSDQAINARRAVDSGVGETIPQWDVTEELLFTRMRQILDNPKYAREAHRKSALLKDRALKPLDESVYWIEYVLRNGRALQPIASKLPFYQIHQLDTLGFAIGLLISLLYFVKVVQFACRRWRTASTNKEKTQ